MNVVRSAYCFLSLSSKKYALIPDNELHCPIIEIPISITLLYMCKILVFASGVSFISNRLKQDTK